MEIQLSRSLEITDLENEIARTNHKLSRFKTIFPIAVGPILFWWVVHAFKIHWDPIHCHLWILWTLVFARRLVLGHAQHVKKRNISRLCELSDTQAARFLLTELTTCSRDQILPILKSFCRVTEKTRFSDRLRIDGPLRRILLGILRDSELPVFCYHLNIETVAHVLRVLVRCDDIISIRDVKRLIVITKKPEVREIAKDALFKLEESAVSYELMSSLLRPSSASSVGNEKLLLPAQPSKPSENIDTLLRPR